MDKMSIAFIDIDGCFNHTNSKDKDYTYRERFSIAQDLVNNLKLVLNAVDDCKIVISSSWRRFRIDEFLSETRNWRDVLCDMLHVPYDTIYGDIPSTFECTYSGAVGRVKDIKLFLQEHKDEIRNFVVIDDECSAIRKAFPHNHVDCEIMTCNGFTKEKANEAIEILRK